MNFDPAEVFNAEFDAAIATEVDKSGFPVDDWIQLGRSAASAPKAQVKTWRTRGVECVQNFIDWYEASGYEIWITPDGKPAIELELRPRFGQVEVVMYIDLILWKPDHLLITDLKSGSKQPDNAQQLGFYASGVEQVYGIRPGFGAFFMNRKGKLVGPTPLFGYGMSIDHFSRQLSAMERGINAKAFLAVPGSHCAICGVTKACAAIGGELAGQYDPDTPDSFR